MWDLHYSLKNHQFIARFLEKWDELHAKMQVSNLIKLHPLT